MGLIRRAVGAVDRYDVAAGIGCALLGRGLYDIYPPLALVVIGTLFILFAISGAKGTENDL